MRAPPSSEPENDTSLLVSMGLIEPMSGRSPSWLVRVPDTISMLWPFVLLARVSVTFLLAGNEVFFWLFRGDIIAIGMILLLCSVDAAIVMTPRMQFFSSIAPHIRLRWLTLLVALSAGLYSLAGSAAFSAMGHGGDIDLMVAIVLPAMLGVAIAGASRVLSLAYCAATFLPLAIGAPGRIFVMVAFVCLTALVLATLAQARTDRANLDRRRSNLMRSEQAQALLTDFEEAGQGWFWETDRNGKLTYVSATLARRLKRDVEDLLGEPMTAVIDQRAHGGPAEGQRTVGFHLSARTAFSEINVRAAGSEEIWWSLSGRPTINEFGQFLGFRGSGADLTEMRKSQAEVARLARFDSLTGLANRIQMSTTLEQSLVDSTGRSTDCALFLLDLDRFKAVNDTMGHPAGDALLRQVAQRLQRVVRDAGIVGRLGGDEFKVVLPGMTDRGELAKLAETIIHSVSQPYAIDGAQVVIGVSVGIAIAPFDGKDADTLTRNADLALYDAKDAGRGVCRFYSEDMHADAEDRRRLEQDLRHAISIGGLHVEYQPVVSTSTERITGFETLVRWNHPTRGAISPAIFIPIAEEAGLVSQIGEWVLRTACVDAVGWPEGTRVAVNVSPIQFRSPTFPNLVMSALTKSGLTPDLLELEITESVFLDEGGDTDAMFAQLKRLGVRLALDDFGTGYSALGYLKSAPFDKIKIDQSFVRGAAIKGSRNGAIVQAIVSLAEALCMETTAEGAETLDELDLVRSLGCSHVQGFVYGRPTRNEVVMESFAKDSVYARASGHKASREQRRTMLRSIKLHHGASAYEGRIRNVSTGGALIEGLADVPAGTVFGISFGNGYVIEAMCRWSAGSRMGVEFAVPIQLDKARAEAVIDEVGPEQRAKVA